MVLHDIYLLAMQENDLEKAHILVEKMQVLYNLFDMGKYHEASCRLELATAEKDADTIIEIMQQMLENLSTIADFRKSPLYDHMEFRKPSEEFLSGVIYLSSSFCDIIPLSLNEKNSPV